MSLEQPTVFLNEMDDGSADITVSMYGEDFRFSISPDGDTGYMEHEETLSWRGQIRTSTPENDVWKAVIQSDKVTDYLESTGLQQVRRKR